MTNEPELYIKCPICKVFKPKTKMCRVKNDSLFVLMKLAPELKLICKDCIDGNFTKKEY